MEVRSDRAYRFDVEPGTVWAALGRVDDYRRWWPWLRTFEAAGLEEGRAWDCVVRPPLPYELRFTIELVEVAEPTVIRAHVSGDIAGRAAVTLRPTTRGSEVRLTSVLAPRRGPLRVVARLTPWLAHYGHDWVLDTGLGQFRRRALPSVATTRGVTGDRRS